MRRHLRLHDLLSKSSAGEQSPRKRQIASPMNGSQRHTNIMPTVKLYANLRKLAGTKELSITGLTLRTVVNELVREHPTVGEIILRDGELGPHIVLTLNGHNITDFETPVTEQDIVAIFPPIAGG